MVGFLRNKLQQGSIYGFRKRVSDKKGHNVRRFIYLNIKGLPCNKDTLTDRNNRNRKKLLYCSHEGTLVLIFRKCGEKFYKP